MQAHFIFKVIRTYTVFISFKVLKDVMLLHE